MYNHFKTLLLNETFDVAEQADEQIPASFKTLPLSGSMYAVYNLLFPVASRFYKNFLTYNYLTLIDAAGMTGDLRRFDLRITYDLQDYTDYFRYSRISNIVYSDNRFKLTVRGKNKADTINGISQNTYQIDQVGSSNSVTIENQNTGDTETIELSFDGGSSVPIKILNTSLNFSIASPYTFTDSSTKQWKFMVESPYEFNFNKLFEKLLLNTANINSMLTNKPSFNTTQYEAIWRGHPGFVNRFAALLIAFVARMDYLYQP